MGMERLLFRLIHTRFELIFRSTDTVSSDKVWYMEAIIPHAFDSRKSIVVYSPLVFLLPIPKPIFSLQSLLAISIISYSKIQHFPLTPAFPMNLLPPLASQLVLDHPFFTFLFHFHLPASKISAGVPSSTVSFKHFSISRSFAILFILSLTPLVLFANFPDYLAEWKFPQNFLPRADFFAPLDGAKLMFLSGTIPMMSSAYFSHNFQRLPMTTALLIYLLSLLRGFPLNLVDRSTSSKPGHLTKHYRDRLRQRKFLNSHRF
jgi:hypothetical protein